MKLKLALLSITSFFFLSLPAYSCIVYSNISDYEISRVEKHLLASPFAVKFLKTERVFERRYSLGSDLVLRIYTRTNSRNAKIYQADLFMGNSTPLPGADKDINKLIKSLACDRVDGIPSTRTEQQNDLTLNYYVFPSGITVIKVVKDEKLMLLQVFDRKMKKEALTE